MLAARVHVRYSSNYWDSCRDHAVFGRIACVIVEKNIFAITLRSQIYWAAVISSSDPNLFLT